MGIEEIAKDIFANVEYDGGNVACINTPEGVVLVDTPMLPKQISEWKDFVLELDPKGARYIINTHIHFDHILGCNAIGGAVIMHERMRESLFQENSTLRESFVPGTPGRTQEEIDFLLSEPLIPSEITVSKDLTLHMGDRTIRLLHLGGHTPDSMVVHVVEDQVLITGDLVTAGLHPYKGDACFSDWIEALEHMQTLDVETVIPGHGPVCTADEIGRLLEYFHRLWDVTADLVSEGRSRDDVIKAVHEKVFDYFEIEPDMLEGARMMFDVGTAQLYKEVLGQSVRKS